MLWATSASTWPTHRWTGAAAAAAGAAGAAAAGAAAATADMHKVRLAQKIPSHRVHIASR